MYKNFFRISLVLSACALSTSVFATQDNNGRYHGDNGQYIPNPHPQVYHLGDDRYMVQELQWNNNQRQWMPTGDAHPIEPDSNLVQQHQQNQKK